MNEADIEKAGGVTRPLFRRQITAVEPTTWNRPPSDRDDATRGFAVGDIWIANGQMFRAARVTSGKAVWLPARGTTFAVPPLPGDVVSGVVAAYGTIQAKSAYTGAALDIERESDDAAATIGFIAGKLDTAKADAHRAGSENRITQWYDQSGNGHHATATGDARPVLPSMNTVGPHRAVCFNQRMIVNPTGAELYQQLTIPETMSVSSQSMTIVSYYKPAHATRDAPLIELVNAAGSDLYFGIATTSGSGGLALRQLSNRNLTPTKIAMEPNAFAVTGSASGGKLHQYGRAPTSFPAIASATLAGGLLGGTITEVTSGSDLAPGRGNHAMHLIFNRSLTDAEISDVAASMHYHYGVTPQKRGVIVFDGNSITEGAWATYYLTWPEQLRISVSRSAIFYNVAISGGTIDSQTTQIANWGTIYDSAAPFNELVFCGGTNNLDDGTSAATMQGLLETYLSTARASGRDWDRIILGTVLPRGIFNSTPAMETQRLLFNDIIRDNAAAWDVEVLDFASDPTMGDTAVVNNTALFPETTHPNVDGLAYMAAIARPMIDRPAI